jgi:UDP-glucose 4-epimerase
MIWRDQVVISRQSTDFGEGTHARIINHELSPECPFCNTKLTTDHILKRMNQKGAKKEMEQLIKYVKKIQLYNGI